MDDFQHFEPFPSETRMEMPEMSYEQELLNTPVPFSNRVEFLSDYEKFDSKPMTAREISDELGISVVKTNTLLSELGASTDENEIYEEYAFVVLKEEVQWQKNYDSLNEFLSASAIGKVLSKSEVWVKQNAYGLGVYAESQNIGKNRIGYVYPKVLVNMLRTVIHQFPPANSLHAIDEVEDILGKDRKWVERIVKEHNLDSEIRTLFISQKPGVHYPQATVDTLMILKDELTQPAGDWMTVGKMAELLSKSRKWVEENIDSFLDSGEPRLSDSGKNDIHYPPEVFEHLNVIIAELPQYASDWMTEWDITQKLNRSGHWVKDKLNSYSDTSKVLLTNKGNRPLVHYPPKVIVELKKIISEEPTAEGWVNAKEIGEMLLKSKDWVRRRLGTVGIKSELRFNRTGQLREHYPPEIIDALQLSYLIDEENALEV
jgi:hypothetical protein